MEFDTYTPVADPYAIPYIPGGPTTVSHYQHIHKIELKPVNEKRLLIKSACKRITKLQYYKLVLTIKYSMHDLICDVIR